MGNKQGKSKLNPDRIFVRVIEAKKLKRGDIFTSDPFVRVHMKGKPRFYTSRVVKNTLNPYWNEMFTLKTTNPEQDVIVLEVYDKDRFTRNDYLGEVHIPVGKYFLNRGSVFDEWLPIMQKSGRSFKKGKGKLHVSVAYEQPTNTQPQQQYGMGHQQPTQFQPSAPMIQQPAMSYQQPQTMYAMPMTVMPVGGQTTNPYGFQGYDSD